jgi:threonine synthase
VNPSLVEGKKTCGLEIAEQCGRDAPDWVVVSVGDGCTIAGIGKGLGQMKELGFIRRVPRLLGVQAQGARPLVDAFRAGRDLVPGPAQTLADSICVGHPRNWRKALRAVRESGGMFVAVPDDAILEAMREAGRRAGVFGEPAGVAGLAGLRHAVAEGIVGRKESALVVVTGSGLKDVKSAIRAAGEPVSLPPDDGALAEHLRARPV